MNRFKILLICLLIGPNSWAQQFRPAENTSRILQDLRKVAAATSSIQASYTEEKKLAVMKSPEHSSGLFYYESTDKMRWEQKMPNKYVILINGDKLRIAEGGKEKNTGQAGRMASQVKEMMIGLVNGDFQDNKAFRLNCLESDDQYLISLDPVNRRLKNIYSKINLVFSKKTLRLKELSFFEKNGDQSVMNFRNEIFNRPLDSSLFLNL